MQGDPNHVYITSYDNVDVWRTKDADGNTIQWASYSGHDSREVIPDSMSIVEYASATQTTDTGTPAPSTSANLSPKQGDASHTYLGTDASGDKWSTVDSDRSNVTWYVRPGDDSRNVLSGTLSRTPGTQAVTVTGANQNGLGAATNAPATAVATNAPANTVQPGSTIAAVVVPSLYGNANASRIQGNTAHRYYGSDATKDYWEITDSDGTVVRWAVLMNHDSREIIPGSIMRVGTATTAATPTNTGATTTTAGTGGGGVNGTVGATNNNGVSTVAFVHPVSKADGQIPSSWRRAGTAANGDPIFSLLDADGTTKTFGLDSQFQAYWTNGVASGGLAGNPTASLPNAVAATDGKAALYVGLAVVALKALVLG